MVAVVTHLGGQVECARQSGLSGAEQELESFVGVGCRAEARILAHRPESVAMHRRIDAAGVRGGPGCPKVARSVERLERTGVVERRDFDARVSVLVGVLLSVLLGALLRHAKSRLREPRVAGLMPNLEAWPSPNTRAPRSPSTASRSPRKNSSTSARSRGSRSKKSGSSASRNLPQRCASLVVSVSAKASPGTSPCATPSIPTTSG